ncbi:MAG: hypothetical protein O7B26_06500 [Planctomycetota bacterium]|nr:hypothetical protein [Planctomycetota bacterium]
MANARVRVGFFSLLILHPAVCGCFNDPVEQLAVWSEFLTLDEVREHLPVLAEHGADLYLAVRPDDLNDALRAFLVDAESAGVAVRPWLQLPEMGIWLNEDNAAEFRAFSGLFLDWADANGIAVEWLIYDIEPAFDYAVALAQAASNGEIGAVIELVLSHRDPARYRAALATMQDMVGDVHARGVRAMAVTLPWIIDDLSDGDPDIQDLFDTPFADIPWDEISVILYRETFEAFFGLPLSPGFVARYAESIHRRYGEDAQVAIGTISGPGLLTAPGYTDPFDVSLDVSAARSAGIRSVSLFSLDGMILAGGVERWLAAASGSTLHYAYPDPFASLIRLGFGGLDALLNEDNAVLSGTP